MKWEQSSSTLVDNSQPELNLKADNGNVLEGYRKVRRMLLKLIHPDVGVKPDCTWEEKHIQLQANIINYLAENRDHISSHGPQILAAFYRAERALAEGSHPTKAIEIVGIQFNLWEETIDISILNTRLLVLKKQLNSLLPSITSLAFSSNIKTLVEILNTSLQFNSTITSEQFESLQSLLNNVLNEYVRMSGYITSNLIESIYIADQEKLRDGMLKLQNTLTECLKMMYENTTAIPANSKTELILSYLGVNYTWNTTVERDSEVK